MELADHFVERCAELYKSHRSIPRVATRLGATLIDVSRALRRARVVTDIQPYELSYILEKTGSMPNRAIMEYLGLSKTQFDQIRRRPGLREKLGVGEVTTGICIAQTRWLVEERLGMAVDDDLPRRISGEAFTDNNLYPLIKFATREKAKCATARHASACAFLVCLAYPDNFKPWQFRHSKTNRYFSGRQGTRNYLDALLWAAQKKMDIPRGHFPSLLVSRGFLPDDWLQELGLGPHWWSQHWSTKDGMLEAFARHVGVEPAGCGLTTARARTRLKEDGVDTTRCAVPGCPVTGQADVQAHHIIRKTTRLPQGFDVDDCKNLIPLCRHHHGLADRFQATEFDVRSPATLRVQLLAKLEAIAPAPEADRTA